MERRSNARTLGCFRHFLVISMSTRPTHAKKQALLPEILRTLNLQTHQRFQLVYHREALSRQKPASRCSRCFLGELLLSSTQKVTILQVKYPIKTGPSGPRLIDEAALFEGKAASWLNVTRRPQLPQSLQIVFLLRALLVSFCVRVE